MTQIFIAVGKTDTHEWGVSTEKVSYVYAFTDPDEAMEFVELAQAHKDDVDSWEILTETAGTAKDVYYRHRKWVEE
jgi:hypothetical protein